MVERKSPPNLSVVIAVCNERPVSEELVQRVQGVGIDKEIIVVDDGSTDGTREFLQELTQATKHNSAVMTLPQTRDQLRTDKIEVFFQEKKGGKGAAPPPRVPRSPR